MQNQDLHLQVIKLEATTCKATCFQKVPLCRKTERGHSQTGTVDKIAIIRPLIIVLIISLSQVHGWAYKTKSIYIAKVWFMNC